MANIALVTLGSAGDVHPMLALAGGLVARGHSVQLLTNPAFAQKAAQVGCPLVPVGEALDYESDAKVEALQEINGELVRVGDLDMRAVFAPADMTTEALGATRFNRRHHAQLAETEMTRLLGAIRRTGGAKDIRHLQHLARHARYSVG